MLHGAAYVVILIIEIFLLADAHGAAVVATGTCPAGVDFEKAGYIIRLVRIDSPFEYLAPLRAAIRTAESNVSTLAGRPYRHDEIRAKGDELERQNFLPGFLEQRVRISLVITSVENCSDHRLDLAYFVFTSQVAPLRGRTFESYKTEKFTPELSAGTDAAQNRWRFSPSIGYDYSELFSGGARLEYRGGAAPRYFPFDGLMIAGRGSATMHEFAATLNGSTGSAAEWLQQADWQINYLNSSDPTQGSSLRQNRFAAQLDALTRPLGSRQLPVRFGGQFEGGTLRSQFGPAELPPHTVDGSGYAALKLYSGTTARLERNVFAVSYGLEVGSIRPGSEVGWLKHIGDIAHDLSLPVADHRSLDIESRLTAGIIQVFGSIPVSARFFGGSREEPFMLGDSWVIRSNPVIRSIPANRFSQVDNGRGGTRFIAYNLTAGIPIWRRPLVPPELTHDREFTGALNGQLETAKSLLQPDYAAKDPHFKLAAGRIVDVQTALANLEAAVNAAQAAAGGQFAPQFKTCASAINTAKRRTAAAATSKSAAQYGDISTLLTANETEDRLNKVRSACLEGLNQQLNDPAVAAAAKALEQIHAEMERDFSLIDQAAASKQAASEMSYVKRTLDSILYELNFLSLGPVVMFDVAHIGPADAKLGTRYGVGGGLRFTLVSQVDFTIGYAANPKRLAGERPGAFFFSMRFKDLLN